MSIKPGDKIIIKIGSVYKDGKGREVYRVDGSDTLVLSEAFIHQSSLPVKCALTESEKDRMIKEAYEKGIGELRDALRDKDFLKVNYGTRNWLHIIRDFEPEQIVSEWKAYHNEKTERHEQEENFRVGDRVRFVGGTMQGIITGVMGDTLDVCQTDGVTIMTTVGKVEKIGGNVLDEMEG